MLSKNLRIYGSCMVLEKGALLLLIIIVVSLTCIKGVKHNESGFDVVSIYHFL